MSVFTLFFTACNTQPTIELQEKNVTLKVGEVYEIAQIVTNVDSEQIEYTVEDPTYLMIERSTVYGLKPGKTMVTLKLKDYEVYTQISFVIEKMEDFLEFQTQIIDKMNQEIEEYKGIEEFDNLLKEYYYKVNEETSLDLINSLYEEFIFKFQDIKQYYDNNLDELRKILIERFNEYVEAYKNIEAVQNLIILYDTNINIMASNVELMAEYNREIYTLLIDKLYDNAAYIEARKNEIKQKIEEYYSKHINCGCGKEIYDDYMNELLTASNAYDVVFVYENVVVNVDAIHYKNIYFDQKYLTVHKSRIITDMEETKKSYDTSESIDELFKQYFKLICLAKSYDELSTISNEFYSKIYNSPERLEEEKSMIKENVINYYQSVSYDYGQIDGVDQAYNDFMGKVDNAQSIEELYVVENQFYEAILPIIEEIEFKKTKESYIHGIEYLISVYYDYPEIIDLCNEYLTRIKESNDMEEISILNLECVEKAKEMYQEAIQ